MAETLLVIIAILTAANVLYLHGCANALRKLDKTLSIGLKKNAEQMTAIKESFQNLNIVEHPSTLHLVD